MCSACTLGHSKKNTPCDLFRHGVPIPQRALNFTQNALNLEKHTTLALHNFQERMPFPPPIFTLGSSSADFASDVARYRRLVSEIMGRRGTTCCSLRFDKQFVLKRVLAMHNSIDAEIDDNKLRAAPT